VFISINFRTTYQELDTNPLAYIAECVRKEWPIAEPLLDLAKQRYHKEYPHLTYGSLALLRDSNFDCDDEKPEPTSKEMNYLSKVLGVMVMLYVSEQDNGQKYGKTTKPNVSAIVEKVLQFMQDNDWDIYGLRKSNLHKKISQALSHVLREVV
jgi:N-acetyl-beta-hexosaminidase